MVSILEIWVESLLVKKTLPVAAEGRSERRN